MSFRYPVLVYIAGVMCIGLLLWTWRRSSGRTIIPSDHGARGRGWTWLIILNLADSIPALLAANALLILAGPQRLGEPQNKRSLTNIELCMDVSGSMTAAFGSGSRYDAAMEAVNQFCERRKGDAVGLTFFGNNTLNWCPLTQDISAIKCSPPFMRPENAPHWLGGTEIAKALRYCRKVLAERSEGDKMILMVTDGDSYDLNSGNVDEMIKELSRDNVTVFAIIIGQTRVQDEMVQVTQRTGGEAFLAGDPEALNSIFRKIDQMKQAKIEKHIAESRDFYEPFCIAGFILAGLHLLTSFGLRYTPW
jgi:Ca-activated chloride channel family protein